MKSSVVTIPRRYLAGIIVPVLGGLYAFGAHGASVCVSESNTLVFSDDAIVGDQPIWVGGFNNGNWMWTGELSCSAGQCESSIVYSGGEVQFRLEGPGVSDYYSPPTYGEMNPPVTPMMCGDTSNSLPVITCNTASGSRFNLSGAPDNAAVALSCTITDSDGINQATVNWNGGQFSPTISGNNYRWSLPYPDEATTLTALVSATDGQGGQSTVELLMEFYEDDEPPVQVPSVPAGLRQINTTSSSIQFQWNGVNEATRYDVYRNNQLQQSVTSTSYTDSGLVANTSYAYQVSACNSSGCSGLSAVSNFRTQEVPDNNTDYSYLNWTANSFVTGKGVGPAPRPDPIDALRTPVNGLEPRQFGFAFDINGSTLSWRWGPSIVKRPGDSSLEMHCSDDGNKTFQRVSVTNSTANIPCSGEYTYFFRYLHPTPLNNNEATAWVWTGLFTTAGSRIDPYAPGAYSFTDGSANWARIRHPITTDGITAAVLDRPNGGENLRNLDRYLIWVNDESGSVDFNMDVSFMDPSIVPGGVVPGFRRNEAMRAAHSNPNGQPFFAVNTAAPFGDDYRNAPQSALEGFDDIFSYGQVISFEFSVEAAGLTSAQTYNDFSHYVVGCGFCGKYGDPRLNMAGRAGTTQIVADAGQYVTLEKNAVFTQAMTTLHSEQMVDDFIVGHHLFHGIKPGTNLGDPERNEFDNPNYRIGERSCGGCHIRDGRGSEVIQTADGPRLPPPTYGVKLLEVMEGREAGFGWDGSADTVAEQVREALISDHKVDPNDLPAPVVDLITTYVEVLTVPARDPGVYDRPGVAEGDILFNEIGCADCHTPVAKTRSDAPTHLRNITIRPYTDMKMHTMNGGEFRTPALWGLGHNIDVLRRESRDVRYLHDGSATSIHQAINAHDGDGAYAKRGYDRLSQSDKNAIAAFIESL
ncbi:di-heme oxidoredictase family protein [Marinibactrum halimedae]|uniref:C-type cytochrome n=1 Tax=Marinibactrum halimedae TaxID=1444977 RepID=A0AA37WN88_9GAMM|nr:di-heme oxidoredictase family protein [Marinibactrum halimedae]MCD9459245.1 hypothetical protein [Marinibactrum halimedae]GLS27318.1 hypothetical protein GCM10007877_30370 [Marinibactrum halimedae]